MCFKGVKRKAVGGAKFPAVGMSKFGAGEPRLCWAGQVMALQVHPHAELHWLALYLPEWLVYPKEVASSRCNLECPHAVLVSRARH